MKDSTRSTLHFALVFLGLCILLAGAVMWVGLREYDHHYSLEGEYDSMPSDWNEDDALVPGASHDQSYADYDELDDRERRIVDGVIEDDRSYTFESPGEIPPTLVEQEGRFYQFDYRRSFAWTDPGMAGSTLAVFLGLWLSFEGIRREQFPHVPFYRNCYRRLTSPIRRFQG